MKWILLDDDLRACCDFPKIEDAVAIYFATVGLATQVDLAAILTTLQIESDVAAVLDAFPKLKAFASQSPATR